MTPPQEQRRGSDSLFRRYRPGLLLAAIATLLLVPSLEGRAWNAIGPFAFNTLNPPEGYYGPVPKVQITAESWGASGVMVPFHARLRSYLRRGDAPWWNPYQGLGQPFAAQGEGCPYSAPAILRALLPVTHANTVTVAFSFLGALAMYGFLRRFSLAESAALFGAVAWLFSGAVILHLARPNLAEQASTIPILFYAAAQTVRHPSSWNGLVLALAAGLHLLGGFIQIAMLSALFCAVFLVFYSYTLGRSVKDSLNVLRSFILGNGLGLFFLLPLIEAMQGSVNKNVELLAMIPMPYANIIAFFFPYAFGHYFQSWIPGQYPDVVDWDNLFAFSGTFSLLLILIGISGNKAWPRQPWRLFAFFAAATLFLQLRYITFPPLGVVNLLPILGRQSPKHAGCLVVFTAITAAAFALHYLNTIWSRRSLPFLGCGLLATISSVAVMVVRQGGWSRVDAAAALTAFAATGGVLFAGLVVLFAIRREARNGRALWLALGLAIGEGILYLPLGTRTYGMIVSRLALMVIILVAGATFLSGRPRSGAAIAFVAAIMFAGYVIPHSNLPLNVDLTRPPASISWLKKQVGDNYRTFGIQPDSSSIWGIQDLSALGPLTPTGYDDFVRLVTTEQEYKAFTASYVFMLAPYYLRYSLARYSERKPIFDAAGIRFLFLDKAYFGPGAQDDDSFLVSPTVGMKVAYEDTRVRILESPEARAKFLFTPGSEVIHVGTKNEALRRIRDNPSSIMGPPAIESAPSSLISPGDTGRMLRLDFKEFAPNHLTVRVQTDGAGLLSTTDVFDPRWHVELNRSAVPLLRADGMFRAVWIPRGGEHDIRFFYFSAWGRWGRWVSLLTGAWLLGMLLLRHDARRAYHQLMDGCGWLLATATVASVAVAYFGDS